MIISIKLTMLIDSPFDQKVNYTNFLINIIVYLLHKNKLFLKVAIIQSKDRNQEKTLIVPQSRFDNSQIGGDELKSNTQVIKQKRIHKHRPQKVRIEIWKMRFIPHNYLFKFFFNYFFFFLQLAESLCSKTIL